MESFESPKQLIVDHYDEVTQQMEIFVEGVLEKSHDFDTHIWRDEDAGDDHETRFRTITRILCPVDNDDSYYDFDEYENNIRGYKDPYTHDYEYDENDMNRVRSRDIVAPKHIRVRGYLELLQSKAIEELKKAENETLESYEINKHLYKYDRESLTDEKMAEMRRSLFREKFCFMIKINRTNDFNKFLIISDFYLDETDLRLLKDRASGQWHTKTITTLNEKSLLAYLVNKYISELLYLENYRMRIISIAKSSILGVKRVQIGFMNIGNVYLPRTSSIDFSSIKSLSLGDQREEVKKYRLYKIRDLSGLVNLEYLRITRMAISSESFYGLPKLIRLSLNDCRCSSVIKFDSLANLEILTLKELRFPVELKGLENLKLVEINEPNDTDDIVNFSESINMLDLYCYDMNNLDEFFARLNLPNLYCIKLERNYTDDSFDDSFVLREKWFDRMKFIKELFLKDVQLSSLDFCQFGCFAQLEKLDVSKNQIEMLNQGVFSQLNRLKSLNLSRNLISHLGSNVFQDLSSLECLFLEAINGYRNPVRIDKDAFNGLTNLKELNLSCNSLGSIDHELFIHTPNLLKLSIRGNNIDIEYIFANLKHFNEVVLCYNDIKAISNEELNKRLKKSNIKIKY